MDPNSYSIYKFSLLAFPWERNKAKTNVTSRFLLSSVLLYHVWEFTLIMKIIRMAFWSSQFLMHYQFLVCFRKANMDTSWKYCLSLPAYLKNSTLPAKASSADYIPDLHAIMLMIKKKKKYFSVPVEQIRANKNFSFTVRITEMLESLGSFRCIMLSILPQKFRVALEDNEVICSQKRLFWWWRPLMEFKGTYDSHCGIPSVLVPSL